MSQLTKINLKFSSMSITLIMLIAFGIFGLLFFQVPQIDARQDDEIKTCIVCHEEQVTTFKDSIHGKKGFDLRSDRVCETCHGSGKEHVNSDGDPEKIWSFSTMTSEKKSEPCLSCHDNVNRMYWAGSTHNSRGLACTECHSAHSAKSEEAQLSAANETDICFSCHKQKASQLYRASHHPIREGKITCSDCHNPHGSGSPRSISADTINEKCYECHAEKRGPFLWDHQPVREDCTICHEPHGTNHFKMIKSRMPYLCQQCHADGGHPSGLYDQSQIESRRFFNRACTNCHTMIHGSNHPSGLTFLR